MSLSIFFLAFILLWVLPIVLLISSNMTSGGEKAAWILAFLFVSWFAWVFYLLLAPLKKPTPTVQSNDV